MDTLATALPVAQPSVGAYRRLWFAAAGSSLGDGMLLAGLPLLADRLSGGDPLAVSVLVLLKNLPWLLIAVAGGAAADRREARQLMVRSDVLRFAIVGVLAFAVYTHTARLWLLWIAAAAIGGLDVLFWAAAQRMIPAVAADEVLARANGQLQVAQNTGEQIVGPAAGGFLFRLGGALPLVGDALSFLISAVLVRGLPQLPAEPGAEKVSYREAITDGFSWFRRSSRVKAVTLVTTAMAFGQAFTTSILVVFGTKALGLGRWVGVFLGAVALGNVVGGLVAERALNRFRQESLLVFTALTASFTYFVAALSPNAVVATCALVFEGICIQVVNTAFAAMRQREVPRPLLGRVATLTRSLIYGAISLGALASGLVGRYGAAIGRAFGAPEAGIGLRSSFICGSLILLMSIVFGARPLRRAMLGAA